LSASVLIVRRAARVTVVELDDIGTFEYVVLASQCPVPDEMVAPYPSVKRVLTALLGEAIMFSMSSFEALCSLSCAMVVASACSDSLIPSPLCADSRRSMERFAAPEAAVSARSHAFLIASWLLKRSAAPRCPNT